MCVPVSKLEHVSKMARWSSGQDGGLSRRKHGFDSRTGHHLQFFLDIPEMFSYNAYCEKTVRREKQEFSLLTFFSEKVK